MNEFPKARLADIADIITGTTPSSKHPDNWGSGVAFLTPSDLSQASWNPHVSRRLSPAAEARASRRVIAPPAVAVTCIASVGKIGFIREPTLTNQQINTLIALSEKADERYLYYAMAAHRDRLLQVAGGSATPNINKTSLSNEEIPLPSLPEQRAIAATLGALDDKIESNRRTFRLLLSLADELFAQSIDHKALSSIPFDDVVHRLQVKHKHSGKSVAPSGRTIVLDQGRNGTLGYHDGDPEFMGTPDSPICLFGDHTCTWRLGLGAFDVGPNVVPVVAKEDSPVDSLWMFFGLRGVQKFQEYRRHWMEFKLHEVPWVDEITQSSFVSVARPMVAMIHELDAQSKRLSEVRDALLPEVFSGRIRVLVEGIDE